VATDCPACDTYVFNKIGKTRADFKALLDLPPILSDGTRSGAHFRSALCPGFFNDCPGGVFQPVSNYFSVHDFPLAVSQTPARKGIVVFFSPHGNCNGATQAGALLNEATLFHEALHGFTGLQDSQLYNALGVKKVDFDFDTLGSVATTYYLDKNIFGSDLRYVDPGGSNPLTCNE
jgi:hypothetical protein